MRLKNRHREDNDQLAARGMKLAAEGKETEALALLASACSRSRDPNWITTTIRDADGVGLAQRLLPTAVAASRRIKSPLLQALVALLYQQAGRADLAATHYLKMGSIRGKVPQAQAGLALSLFQSGKQNQAFGHAEKAYRMLPNAGTAYLVARKRMAELRPQDAVLPLQEAMADPETAASAALSFALVEHLMDRSEEGLTMLQRALAAGAQEEDVLPNYPEFYLALGRVDEAEAALERAKAMMAEEQVLCSRTEIAVSRGDAPRAEALLAELRPRWPLDEQNAVRLHCIEARLLGLRGQVAEAAERLRPYAEVPGTLPRFSWMPRMMGEWALRQGKTGEALDWFDRAAAKNPRDPASALAQQLREQFAALRDRVEVAGAESPKEAELRILRSEYEAREAECRTLRRQLEEVEAEAERRTREIESSEALRQQATRAAEEAVHRALAAFLEPVDRALKDLLKQAEATFQVGLRAPIPPAAGVTQFCCALERALELALARPFASALDRLGQRESFLRANATAEAGRRRHYHSPFLTLLDPEKPPRAATLGWMANLLAHRHLPSLSLWGRFLDEQFAEEGALLKELAEFLVLVKRELRDPAVHGGGRGLTQTRLMQLRIVLMDQWGGTEPGLFARLGRAARRGEALAARIPAATAAATAVREL